MSMQWTWNGWTIRGTADRRLRFETQPSGAVIDADQIQAFAELLVALARMAAVATSEGTAGSAASAKSDGGKVAAKALVASAGSAADNGKPAEAAKPAASARAEAAPIATKGKPGPKPKAAAGSAKSAAVASDDDVGRSRQGTTLRVDGKPVKRGPKAAAARFAAAAAAKRAQAKTSSATDDGGAVEVKTPVAAPAAVAAASVAKTPVAARAAVAAAPRTGTGRISAAAPRPMAARPATSAPQSAPSEDISDLPPAVQEVVRSLDARARLLRPVVVWMARLGRPVTMDEIVAATKANKWSASDSPQPALNATLQRAAEHFVRDHAGAFSLRALRPEAKVVVRRHSAATGADDAGGARG